MVASNISLLEILTISMSSARIREMHDSSQRMRKSPGRVPLELSLAMF
jgi:hypothetical protein